MNHPELIYQLAKLRNQEDIAAAKRSHLAAQAKRTAQRSAPTAGLMFLSLARMLSFIGTRLLSLSCRLQGRYQVLVSAEAARQVKPCI